MVNKADLLLQLPIEDPDILPVLPNPFTIQDYLIQMIYPVAELRSMLILRFIPDRKILDQETFETVANDFKLRLNPTADHLPSLIKWSSASMNLINNEVVPRFIQVILIRTAFEFSPTHIAALFEDRMPGYDAIPLLKNLDKMVPDILNFTVQA